MRLIDADRLKEKMATTLEVLKHIFPPGEQEVHLISAFATVGEMADDCPTIDAMTAWIPVTERLPEPYSGEYLVTINDGSVYTDILWFDSPGDGRYESCFYKTDDDGYGVVCDDVIAWMPLPEPHKGERAEEGE